MKQKKIENKKVNLGTNLITTNKISWNCNNSRQCKSLDYEINKLGNEIELILNPAECELECRNKNYLIITLNDVRCSKLINFHLV